MPPPPVALPQVPSAPPQSDAGSMSSYDTSAAYLNLGACFVCGVTLAWLSTCVLPMHPCLLRQLLGSGLARAGAGWWSLFGA